MHQSIAEMLLFNLAGEKKTKLWFFAGVIHFNSCGQGRGDRGKERGQGRFFCLHSLVGNWGSVLCAAD